MTQIDLIFHPVRIKFIFVFKYLLVLYHNNVKEITVRVNTLIFSF